MAKRIKIEIRSTEDNFKIKFPCPFWLIKFSSYSGINIISLVKKFSPNKYLDRLTKEHTDLIKMFIICSLKELKKFESFDLVDIVSEDGEVVKISIV